MKSKLNPTKSKKGSSDMWWVIIGGIIALVAVILIILFVRGALGRSQGVTDGQFDSFGDLDCDKATNFLDTCPCSPTIQNKEQLGDQACPIPGSTCEQTPSCKPR